MLATLTHQAFSSEDWLYERKLDGVRCLAFRRRGRVRLLTRNRQPAEDTFPEIVESLGRAARADFVLDGEVVCFDGLVTSFARLQQRLGIRDPEEARSRGVAVHFYALDVLHWGGRDLTGLGTRDRKRVLRRALSFDRRVRFTPHRVGAGEAALARACRKGWEGLIAKRGDAPYRHGRSRDWLKLKCGARQELVIGGFTDPRGSRTGFGALLVGHHADGELRYAGKVGTGFDDAVLEDLSRRLRRLGRDRCPFADPPRERGAHWVSPRLVAEVGFTEWTGSGKLRHPRFLGLRHDKPPRQVRREHARPAPVAS